MRKFLRVGLIILAIGGAIVLVRYRTLIYAVTSTVTRRVGSIDFYGADGVDVKAVRAGLPLKVGDWSAPLHFGGTRNAKFEQVTGHKPVNVNAVCCAPHAREWVFVGLGGHEVPLNPPPTGTERLSKPLRDLYVESFFALFGAIGRGNATEEHSSGYALSSDPALRSVQLRMREAALKNEQELLTVAANSGDAPSRQAAVQLLGYARRSKEQLVALGNAARDVDDAVRNNATRALLVILDAFPDAGHDIDLDYFLDLMNSSVWTDRNKASGLLAMVSRSRDQATLARIRAKAFDPLLEMARWKAPHRVAALQILGRMSGIDESSLLNQLQRERYDDVLAAVH